MISKSNNKAKVTIYFAKCKLPSSCDHKSRRLMVTTRFVGNFNSRLLFFLCYSVGSQSRSYCIMSHTGDLARDFW